MSLFNEEGHERMLLYGHMSDLGLILEDRKQTTFASYRHYYEEDDELSYLERPGSINAAWSFGTTDNPEVAMALLESMRCRENLKLSEQGRISTPLLDTEDTLRYILDTQFNFEFDNLNNIVTQSLLSSATAARDTARDDATRQKACRKISAMEDKLKALKVRPRQVARAKEVAEECLRAIEKQTSCTESEEIKRLLSEVLAVSTSTVDQGSSTS